MTPTRPEPFWFELSRRLGFRAETRVAVLWGYFDESGLHDPASGHLTHLVVAGGIAPSGAWDVLATAWEAALDRVGVECFHMVDFEADEGEFKGWKKNRTDDRSWLLNTLLDLVVENVPELIGFGEIHGEESRFKDTYGKVVAEAFEHFTRQFAASGQFKKGLLFAKHPQYPTKTLHKLFEKIASGDLLTATNLEPMGNPEIQVADIVAYEMSRAVRPGRPERYPLKRLKAVPSCRLVWA